MNKLSIIFALFLAIASGSIQAQQSADQLIKATVDKIKSHKNVEISFDYQMINKEANINESQSGKGSMQGESYKLILSGQEIISDGATVWTYLSENDEVMVSDVSQNEMGMNPLKLLTSYNKDYSSKFITGSKSNKNSKLIEMTAKKGNFKKVIIEIDEKKQTIERASVFDENGNEFVVKCKEMLFDKNYPSNYFSFDAKSHPEAEIIDMR